MFGSRRRKLHAHEASSGAGLPSRVQRTAFDYGWATQRRASRSARCQTKDQRRPGEECLEERQASVDVCRIMYRRLAVTLVLTGYSHSRQALQSRSVEAAQALAALPRRRRELPPLWSGSEHHQSPAQSATGAPMQRAQPIAPFPPSLQTPYTSSGGSTQRSTGSSGVGGTGSPRESAQSAPGGGGNASRLHEQGRMARSGPAYTAQDWISRLFVDRMPGCSEQVILIRRLILSHRLRHCTKLGNAETEANGAFREEEITVVDDEYTSTRACLGGLGDADALHMPASITRQT